MKKKLVAFVACFAFVLSGFAADSVAAPDVAKIKSEVAKLGTGEKARVRITTRDNQEVKGFIRDIGENSFVVRAQNSTEERALAYSDVAKVRGPGLSKGAKIGITLAAVGTGVGITAGVILAKCGNYCR